MPISWKADREAVEWSFSLLLSEKTDDSCSTLFSLSDQLGRDAAGGMDVRIALLCDLTDCWSAGAAIALLRFLRAELPYPSVNVSLIAVTEASAVRNDAFFPSLRLTLRDLEHRRFLRRSSDDDNPLGADSMCFISLPSSMVESPESHRLVFLSAARFLAETFSGEQPAASGLYLRKTSGAVSLSSLGKEAPDVAVFIQYAGWLLSDLLPSLRAYLARPGRLRSLQPYSRNGLFRSLFADSDVGKLNASLDILCRSLKAVLSEILAFLQSVPSPLRFSEETCSQWKQASDACGRYITVASEYDVTLAEVQESGIEKIKPVHRDSLSDTEEELLQRRLLQMADQLESEKQARDQALKAAGPFRAVQALQECLRMCTEALESARAKASVMSPEESDHLTIARQERRIRLLEAAVARSNSELTQTAVIGEGPPAGVSGQIQPPAGVLSSAAYSALFRFLSPDASETAEKDLRDLLPQLLDGYVLPDGKDLLKDLIALCRNASSGDPLLRLLIYAWNTCQSGVAALSFSRDTSLPDVPLLPDLIPSEPVRALPDLLRLIPGNAAAADSDTADLRGLLAMLMLRPYKRRESRESFLKVKECDPGSPFVGCWLACRDAARVQIISLASAEDQLTPPEAPFALVIPGRDLIPARRLSAYASLVPPFVSWYDASNSSFLDPCSYLAEGDSSLLFFRLSAILESWPEEGDPHLRQFLSDFMLDLGREKDSPVPDRALPVRIKAVCGLLHLPAYDGSMSRIVRYYEHFLADDPVASCLTGLDGFPASPCSEYPDEVLYAWRGIPFAREHSHLILESPVSPGEEHILSLLETECGTLSGISDDYRDALVREGTSLLSRFPDASSERRETVNRILEHARRPVSDQTPVLSWPWDPLSPSIRTVLMECLGETVSQSFVAPFSDLLAIFPARSGEVIGDSMFDAMCRVMPYASVTTADSGISADAVLPPLSAPLIRAVCLTPEGRVLLSSEFLSLERPDESSIRVTLTLNGAFALRLSRIYAADEIVPLYAHDIPTLSLWPSVPFRPADWRAYFVYAHLPDPFSVSVLTEAAAEPMPLNGEQHRYVSRLDRFPSAFLFFRDGHSLGALPNILPEPCIETSGDVTACVDFGSVGTSVVFSSGTDRKPLRGPTMVRTILNNPAASRDLLRREFLPAVPVSALLPTASRIFRNVPGALPVPFVDGIVLMSSDLQDVLAVPSDALYTCMKWEEEKGRSGFLCLHQIMLMAALQARSDGAATLSWRFALPDEMAAEGRESLRSLFCRLVENVHRESGFPFDACALPVSFASESTALGAYFRLCAWEDTRGGFMVLDIGACTADISLFLRGREQAVRTCQIPLGVHYMLLPSLLRDPLMLQRDFGSYPDETFCSDLASLTKILSSARTDPPSLRKARMALDHFLADHYPQLVDAISCLYSSGAPSRFGALLLLHLAYLMMLSGLVLLQIAADPNKNDFLPEQMSLCLSGRGALLIENLPDPVKTALWRFLTMFRNKRVASLSLLFSVEKKMEIPVGLSVLQTVSAQLPPASSVPASLSVRPEELLPEFLLRFAREFPSSALVLFPDFFTGDYYHPFSSRGESAVTAALDQSFTIRETPRPYDSLASWISSLLDAVF